MAYAGGSLVGNAAATLISAGQVQSGGLMMLTAGNGITHSGLIDAQDALRITSASLVNTGTVDATGGALFLAGLNAFDNTGGTLSSDTGIQIELSDAQTLNAANWGTVQSADWLTLQGANGGEITSLNIAADTEILANGQLVVKAGDLINAGTVASVDGNLLVQASADMTNEGLIYAGGALLAIRAGGTVLNDGGVVLAAANLLLCGASTADCTQDLAADRAGALVNHDGGIIETLNGDMILAAALIKNERDGTSSVDEGTPRTVLINNDPGGCSGVCLGNDSYDYTKDRVTTTIRTVSVGGTSSSIISSGNLILDATGIANDYSLISAAGDLNVQAGVLTNRGDQSTTTISTVVENWEFIDRTWPSSNVRRIESIDAPIVTIDVFDIFPGTIEAGGTITGDVVGTLDNGAVTENVAALTAIRSGATAPTLGSPNDITGNVDLSVLGNDQLFVTNPGGGEYLIETRAGFIDQDQFISSDYFLASLDFDPDATQIRLGDPFAETYLIRNQIIDLTGRRILDSDLSEKEQIRRMYDNAVDAAADLDLRPGVALTPEQIAALTTDIVWLEEQVIDGQTVLVPRVYLGASGGAGGAFDPATIIATNVAFNVGSLTNSGAITAFDTLVINASADIQNLGGSLTAADLLRLTSAQGDLLNLSGTISGGAVTVVANEIISETDVIRFVDGNNVQEIAAPSALITATSGVLTLDAAGDITVVGGDLSGQTGVTILAGGDIDFAALELNSTYDGSSQNTGIIRQLSGNGASGGSWSFTQTTQLAQVSTITSAQGGVSIVSAQRGEQGNIVGGGDILFEGTQITAAGVIDVTAVGGDVVFEAATSTFSLDRSYETSNLFSEASEREQRFDVTNETASLSAETISIYAGGDVAAFGTQFTTVDNAGRALTNEDAVAIGRLDITAADGDVLFYAVQDIRARSYESASSNFGGIISFEASSQSLRSSYQGVETSVLTDINLSAENGDLIIQGGAFSAEGNFNTDVGGQIYLQGTVDTRYAFTHNNDNNGFLITDSTQVTQSQVASMPTMRIGETNSIEAANNVVIGGRVLAVDDAGAVTGFAVGTTHVGAQMGASTLSELFPSSEGSGGTNSAGDDPYADDTTVRQAVLNPGGAGASYLNAVLANENTLIGERVDLTSIDYTNRTQSMGVLSQAALMLITQGMGTWATFAVNQIAQGVVSGEFDPEEIVKSAAMTFVTAGVGDLNPAGFQGVGGWAKEFTADMNATGVFGNTYFSEKWLVETALTTGVTSTAQTALYGGDLADNWTDAMQGAAINQMVAMGIDASSDQFGHDEFTPENFTIKATLNCLGSMAGGSSCPAGVMGSIAKELYVANADTTGMTEKEITNAVARTAIVAGVLTSQGDVGNLNSTVNAANLDLQNNYLNKDQRAQADALFKELDELCENASVTCVLSAEARIIQQQIRNLQGISATNTLSMYNACEAGETQACATYRLEAAAYEEWATGPLGLGMWGMDRRSRYFDVSAGVVGADVDYGGNLDALILDAFEGVSTDAEAAAAVESIMDRAVNYDGLMNLTVGTGSVAAAGVGCFFTGGLGCAVVLGGAALAEGNNIIDGAMTLRTGEATDGLIQQAFEAGGLSPDDARQYEEWVETGLVIATLSADGILVLTTRSGTLLASADDIGGALAASTRVDAAPIANPQALVSQFDSWQPPAGYVRNPDGSVTHASSGQLYTPSRGADGQVRVDGSGNPIFNTQSGGTTAQTTLTSPSTSGQNIEIAPNRTVVDVSDVRRGTPEYEALNNPRPNTTTELSNGTTFRTGEGGYVDEVTYQPVNSSGVRDGRQTAVGREGIAGDVGGHIQACRHGGTCDRFNLFPQNSNFNNSAYKRWENEITRSLQNGDDVGNVTVRLNRADPYNPRPDSLEIEYQINGETRILDFRNEAGG